MITGSFLPFIVGVNLAWAIGPWKCIIAFGAIIINLMLCRYDMSASRTGTFNWWQLRLHGTKGPFPRIAHHNKEQGKVGSTSASWGLYSSVNTGLLLITIAVVVLLTMLASFG